MNNPLEISLMDAAYRLYEANYDIEAYLPPDDSDSWGDNASDLLTGRDDAQKEFDDLINEIKAQAIEDAIRYASDKVREKIPRLKGDADLVSSELLKSYASLLRQSAEAEE